MAGGSAEALAGHLAAALRAVEDVAGPAERDGAVVRLPRLDLTLSGDERPSGAESAAIVHAHVVTHVGRGADERLDACLFGVNADRDRALAEIAGNYLTLVGAPLLSLLTRRYVLQADDFHGEESWGVAGCHGSVGPASARTRVPHDELRALSSAAFFSGAEALITDTARLHLLKANLVADRGPWQRTLELDGHGSTRVDEDYRWEVPSPSGWVSAVRFAVVFRVPPRPA